MKRNTKKIIDEYTNLPLTRGKKNYLRNKEKEKARSRAKYIKFKDKILARGKLWRLNNPEKVKEYYLKHYKKTTIKKDFLLTRIDELQKQYSSSSEVLETLKKEILGYE